VVTNQSGEVTATYTQSMSGKTTLQGLPLQKEVNFPVLGELTVCDFSNK